MFEIELADIGGDNLIMSFKTSVDTLPEAEVVALGRCSRHLQRSNLQLIHLDDLIYALSNGDKGLGLVKIKSL